MKSIRNLLRRRVKPAHWAVIGEQFETSDGYELVVSVSTDSERRVSVRVDYESGNYSEGITTFLSASSGKKLITIASFTSIDFVTVTIDGALVEIARVHTPRPTMMKT